MAQTLILCRRKVRNNSSGLLEQELLARGVDVYRATPLYHPRTRLSEVKRIINHGVSRHPVWRNRLNPEVEWLNTPGTVYISANKLRTMEHLERARVPQIEWTVDREVAERWVADGSMVMARLLLGGARGRGIQLSPPDLLADAPLYTKRFAYPRVREYRVYIVGTEVAHITEKKRYRRERLEELGIDRDDPYTRFLRTNGNGWVFAHHNHTCTPEESLRIQDVALECATALDLRWGAVDLVAGWRNDELVDIRVIEPNTSIGIHGDRNTRNILADTLSNLIQEPLVGRRLES